MEKGEPLQWTVLGKLDTFMQKNETGLLSHTIYKYQLKMNYINLRPEAVKLDENMGKLSWHCPGIGFMDMTSKAQAIDVWLDKNAAAKQRKTKWKPKKPPKKPTPQNQSIECRNNLLNEREYFQTICLMGGLMSKIHKEFK